MYALYEIGEMMMRFLINILKYNNS
jgi:hypothetical protein